MSGIRRLNGKGIAWVVNYRHLQQAKRKAYVSPSEVQYWYKAVKEDHHTAASIKWTMTQADLVAEHGWDKWLQSPAAEEGYKFRH